jgi:hypothetical protein
MPTAFTLVRESRALSESERAQTGRGLRMGAQMTATDEDGGTQASKLIRVRDGGIVGISRGPWGAAGRPMIALHVHGYEGFEELSARRAGWGGGVDGTPNLGPPRVAAT